MELTMSNIITIAIYLITFGTVWGKISTQLSNLEKKVEKHNHVIERVYRCEESLKSAHHRLDEMRGKS